MIVVILVCLGHLIDLGHGAAISSRPSIAINNTLGVNQIFDANIRKVARDAMENNYVKLPPGSDIYFYKTKNNNVLLGHKLQSNEEVTISFIHNCQNGEKFVTTTSMGDPVVEEIGSYGVLKSSVLVPRIKNESDEVEYNKCVYQSLKPVYYVKGFRNILIPADLLYSKAIQNELFPESIDSFEGIRFPLTNLDTSPEEICDGVVIPTTKSNFTFTSYLNEIGPNLRFNGENSIDDDEGEEEETTDSDGGGKEIYPDKTCNGEVTLFALRNDGILRRITADPYIPEGLHLTFSLLSNVVFHPKFLGGSEHMTMSYVTGENGDLIPHRENSHRVTAEAGSSVLFMLGKNGGLFPVKEEKKLDKKVRYYYNGRLVHEGQQLTETFSNCTSVLINNKRIQLFSDNGDVEEEERFPLDFDGSSNDVVLESEQLPNKRHHHHHHRHLRKRREASFYDCDRNLNGHPPDFRQPGIRGQLPYSEESGGHITEYHQQHGLRNPDCYGSHGRRTNNILPEPAPMSEPRYSDAHHPPDIPQGSIKTATAPYDPDCKAVSSGYRGSLYAEPVDHYLDPEKEDTEVSKAAPLNPRTDLFIFDDKGTRIRLIPEITDSNDVVIYKLTCKGNLVRYPPCKEPEFGFEINFQLLLDEFVLVPTVTTTKRLHLTYVLQENGDLIPSEDNENTFRKAPGSLIYYMLGKNNVLFPIQQVIDMDGNVSFYYQDFFLLKMKDSVDKPLHFTTKGSPLFAFFNSLTIISLSSKPRLNTRVGSNWKQVKPSDSPEPLPKTMYLTGPKGELIRITPYRNRQGSTVVYELDCNGILYRSPKDKKKCIILKSYILLKEGILVPSNDTNGYVYMMSKNGDLFPYLYPDGKIEAPLASSLKYVLCEKGILLPIKLEIIGSSICYIFRDVIVYKERIYCKSCLDRMSEHELDDTCKSKKSSCDTNSNDTNSDMKLFVNKNGDYVFYEKQNKILKRYPPEAVPAYLKYTMGSFEVKPDGSLYQIRYQDPSANVANLMLEPNGDLLEDTRNVNNVRSRYYVLNAKGNLIAVEARRAKKNIYFFKGSTKVCKVPFADDERTPPIDMTATTERTTPLGKDPMNLMEAPYPSNDGKMADTRSLYIPIPLKSVSVSNTADSCQQCGDPEHKKKCDMLKDTLKQVSSGNALPLALELELTDEIIEELKTWAAKCDKVLRRRDVNEQLLKLLNRGP
ncbi:hypothetical protein RUM43_011578 [Polyplax serrata]|uniref:Uncharacterized protein n=1 Tax=Polyplax serrata TaxID=468196 RepID=A0AAN8S157_POLSC